MGLRFRKSFKIAPGIRMNVGKKGVGVSFGGNGLRYTIHSSGRRTSSVGIPGSGLYYTTTSGGRSYNSDAYKRRGELARHERENRKLQEQDEAQLLADLFENKLELFKSIHHECDAAIDWNEVASRKPPFPPGGTGPRETEALERLSSYTPGFFGSLFGRAEKKKADLAAAADKAKEADAEMYKEWETMKTIANRVTAGDIDAYFEVIEEFAPLDDLVEFGSGFEFGTDNPDEIHINFDVNFENVIPDKQLSLTKTGRLSEKAMTKTMYYDLCQDYVCSCALRIARDMFALLPVSFVFVHANEDRLNTATGNKENTLILSVKYDRGTLEGLNFTALDPSDSLMNFPHEMDFRKTAGFREVDEVTC